MSFTPLNIPLREIVKSAGYELRYLNFNSKNLLSWKQFKQLYLAQNQKQRKAQTTEEEGSIFQTSRNILI